MVWACGENGRQKQKIANKSSIVTWMEKGPEQEKQRHGWTRSCRKRCELKNGPG